MKFSLPESRYGSNEQIAAFCRQVLDKVATTPGVRARELLRRSAADAPAHDPIRR